MCKLLLSVNEQESLTIFGCLCDANNNGYKQKENIFDFFVFLFPIKKIIKKHESKKTYVYFIRPILNFTTFLPNFKW